MLHIRNLPENATEDGLREHFEHYPAFEKARIINKYEIIFLLRNWIRFPPQSYYFIVFVIQVCIHSLSGSRVGGACPAGAVRDEFHGPPAGDGLGPHQDFRCVFFSQKTTRKLFHSLLNLSLHYLFVMPVPQPPPPLPVSRQSEERLYASASGMGGPQRHSRGPPPNRRSGPYDNGKCSKENWNFSLSVHTGMEFVPPHLSLVSPSQWEISTIPPTGKHLSSEWDDERVMGLL